MVVSNIVVTNQFVYSTILDGFFVDLKNEFTELAVWYRAFYNVYGLWQYKNINKYKICFERSSRHPGGGMLIIEVGARNRGGLKFSPGGYVLEIVSNVFKVGMVSSGLL